MNTNEWNNNRVDCQYFYCKQTGRIKGQVHSIAHTSIWIAKVYKHPVQETVLGQFITMEHCKKAVEEFWLSESMTLIE